MSALVVMLESDRSRSKNTAAIAMYIGLASTYHKMKILTTCNDKCIVASMSEHTELVMTKVHATNQF